jgi:hypothetical protein
VKRYRYAAFECSPTATGEASLPFLVVVTDLTNDLSIKLFINNSWKSQTPRELQRYLADTISSVSDLSAGKLNEFQVELKEHSVGPLRFGFEGTCEGEKKLHELLTEAFRPFGYSNLELKAKKRD